MRRKKIMVTIGDKVYYSYWYRNTNEVVIFCRSRLFNFHTYSVGKFKLKSPKEMENYEKFMRFIEERIDTASTESSKKAYELCRLYFTRWFKVPEEEITEVEVKPGVWEDVRNWSGLDLKRLNTRTVKKERAAAREEKIENAATDLFNLIAQKNREVLDKWFDERKKNPHGIELPTAHGPLSIRFNAKDMLSMAFRAYNLRTEDESVRSTKDLAKLVHSWIEKWHMTLEDYERLPRTPEGKAEISEASLGVGDGSGKLIVHGSFEAVKALQEKLFRLEQLDK